MWLFLPTMPFRWPADRGVGLMQQHFSALVCQTDELPKPSTFILIPSSTPSTLLCLPACSQAKYDVERCWQMVSAKRSSCSFVLGVNNKSFPFCNGLHFFSPVTSLCNCTSNNNVLWWRQRWHATATFFTRRMTIKHQEAQRCQKMLLRDCRFSEQMLYYSSWIWKMESKGTSGKRQTFGSYCKSGHCVHYKDHPLSSVRPPCHTDVLLFMIYTSHPDKRMSSDKLSEVCRSKTRFHQNIFYLSTKLNCPPKILSCYLFRI